MPKTRGINHLGLSVDNLDETVAFFTECLGWEESGRDPGYPRSSVTDGVVRLTLWQVDHENPVNEFQRRQNIGLHHLALEIETEEELNALSESIQAWPDVKMEFLPEFVGNGPRKHMMCYEPGGIRIEFIWPGT